jgi:hypothetical protein
VAHDSVCRTLQSCDGMQFATGANLIKQEGFLALYSGLVPAVGRGLFYGKLSLAITTKRSLIVLPPHGTLGLYAEFPANLALDRKFQWCYAAQLAEQCRRSPVRHMEASIREGLEAQRNSGMERNAGGPWLGTYSPGKWALGGNEEHISLLRSWWRAASVGVHSCSVSVVG